jgi:hypothetical protein
MLSKLLALVTNTTEAQPQQPKEITVDDLNFNDRITYLAWRKEWKEAYFAAIAAVRAGKQAFKTEQRKVTIVQKQYAWGPENIPMYGEKSLDWRCEDYYKWYRELPRLVGEIEKLVRIRQEGRIKSAAQREEMLKERGLV